MAERTDPIEPGGVYLGEFRRGPAIFTVFRVAARPDRYHVMCSDGNGPSPVCVFTGEPGSEPNWHGAWNGDEWCPWIEAEAREIAGRLRPGCGGGRPLSVARSLHGASRCAAAPDPMPSRGPPEPRRGPAGRSIMVEVDRPASPRASSPPRVIGFTPEGGTFGLDPDATGGFTIGDMSEYTSPVPAPGPDATAPEPYREIYPMPMFVTIPTADFAASKDFWMRGLGFIDLFSVPEQVAHLRRWAFQDVLLVAGDRIEEAPPISVSFACVENELDGIAARCERIAPGSVAGPAETRWNTLDTTIATPEGARVVMTAARPLDRDGEKAAEMREMGLDFV